MIKGFKDFIMGGNLIDLAVAFVTGAAFVALADAFTTNLISPIVGILSGDGGFDTLLKFSINGSTFYPGKFIAALITFLTTMAAIYFFVVKPYQRLRKPDAPAGPSEVELLTEIRDSLKVGR